MLSSRTVDNTSFLVLLLTKLDFTLGIFHEYEALIIIYAQKKFLVMFLLFEISGGKKLVLADREKPGLRSNRGF